MAKKLLILRACGINEEREECDNIKIQAQLYGISVNDFCPKTNGELETILHAGETYDYIYLSSHGNVDGFGNEQSTISYSWFDFGVLLCGAACMNPDCIILLSCCRGGLSQIAYDLFYCCTKISYVVGPRQSLFPHDMLISFNILLYNLEHRNLDPIVACEKIKLGTDIRFICFDRLETEAETAYILRTAEYEKEWKESLNEARKEANEPPVPISEGDNVTR